MIVKSLVMMSKLRAAVVGIRSSVAEGGDVGQLRLVAFLPTACAALLRPPSAVALLVTRPAGFTREEALWTSR